MPFVMPEPQSDQTIRELAEEITRQVIWVAGSNVPNDAVSMVFLPITLGALAGAADEQLDQLIVFAIGGMHATAGWQINGLPTFTECCVWLRTDFRRALRLARKMQLAMSNVEEDPHEGTTAASE